MVSDHDVVLHRPHVLGPSSTDLVKYGHKKKIVTRRHSDVNFLTIHGRPRYPGLDIWVRNCDQRIEVEIPPGNYLFVQAGRQFEHITGGLIKAVLHEVVVNDRTLEVSDSDVYISLVYSSRVLHHDQVIERRKVEFPDRPLIRVSSSFFWNLSLDFDLVPITALEDKAGIVRRKNLEAGLEEGDEVFYEPMKVAEQIRR